MGLVEAIVGNLVHGRQRNCLSSPTETPAGTDAGANDAASSITLDGVDNDEGSKWTSVVCRCLREGGGHDLGAVALLRRFARMT